MTEYTLQKRITYFAERLEATRPRQDTPQGKRAHSLARNKWREARRQLIRLQETGTIRGWHEVRLPTDEE